MKTIDFDDGYIDVFENKLVIHYKDVTIELSRFRSCSLASLVQVKEIVDTVICIVYTPNPTIFYSSPNLFHMNEVRELETLVERLIDDYNFLKENKKRVSGFKVIRNE